MIGDVPSATAIAEFGRRRRKFLEQFLDLSAGIPSHDRFNAIFAALKPAEFEKCLLSWITALHEFTKGQIIAIDGKTLRRSYDKARGKWTRDVRCYILSVLLTAWRFGEAARGHWAIENRCHWQLDVTFQEDQCRLRKGHADANFAVLRRMAISLLKNYHGSKVGIKNKRLIAALDEQYLTEVLLGK